MSRKPTTKKATKKMDTQMNAAVKKVVKKKTVSLDADGKLPSVFQGDGFKIVDINSSASTAIVLESVDLVDRLNEWDSDVVDYGKVAFSQAGRSPVISMAAVLAADNIDELAKHAPELSEALNSTVLLRHKLISDLISNKKPISFELLGEALTLHRNKCMLFRVGNHQVYGRFISARLQRSFYGPYYQVTYTFVTWEDGKLVRKSNTIKVFQARMPTLFEDWGFKVDLSDVELQNLLTQGRKLISLNEICGHIHITGNVTYRLGWSLRESPATGRAVVDKAGMAMFVPGDSLDDYEDLRDSDSISKDNITDDDIRSMDPYLYVFSFAAKRWGRIHYDQVSDIQFRTNAFEKLVLSPEDKSLVLSLVKHSDSTMVSDLIDNKGGGCVLLLHGTPGLGKTLTAEAVAEVLHRPLYSVSVGELGVDPEMLEERLQRSLQTAQRWNAVLLLDEADIFLESRRSGDVARNAMVGTFLRLLEYYNGVLILTTNRVADIDAAFYSRISLALKYSDFDVDTRIKVIQNLLDTNGVVLKSEAVQLLANQNVNGRQVKNAIRLARFMAKDQARDVDVQDIMLVLNKLQQFQHGFNSVK